MTITADHGATGLETGWGPDTPADDTVLRQYLVASVDAWITVADSVGGRVERNDRFVAVDWGRPSGIFDNATLLRPVFGSALHRRGCVPGPAVLHDDRFRLLIGSCDGEAVCAAAHIPRPFDRQETAP